MSSQEQHQQAINENEMAYDSNQATSKKALKQKKLDIKQEPKKPIDGKQQFGDKSICRLCQVSTKSTLTIICIRCHFKYHQECIRKQNKEPQFEDGIKWHSKRKLKESKPSKKKQCNQIQDFFQKTVQPQEDKIKKLTEFQLLYPTYIQQGRVIFPILDEYLTAYQGLFNIEPKKKPALHVDPAIPQEIFEDVLKIWDAYNNMNKIVSDILQEQQIKCLAQSQSNNIGTLIHFQDNHTLYNQKSRIEIYDTLQHNPQEIILFFCYFYLKQIIEDLDIEQMQKQQYKIPYWQLMGYMWYTNRQRYYQLLRDDVKSLPTNIFKQGILYLPDYLIDFGDYKNVNKLAKLVIALADGIESLKRTQFLYQYRTENILSNNRMKTQLGMQIKEQRSKQMETNKEIIESEGNYQMAKSKLLEDGLSRAETQKFIKQKESAQKQCQKLKQQFQKLEKEIDNLTERYHEQEKELAIIQISSLVLNPSVFLGYDSRNSSYYFFLWESDKIFACMRNSIIDDEVSQWGYYDLKDVNVLMEVLCQKGVKENSLRNNILELQRAKLLIVEQKEEEEEEKEDKLKNSENNSEQDVAQNNSSSAKDQKVNSLENLDIDMLIQEFLDIENMLTEYLNQRNSRWCSSEIRNSFLKSFQNVIQKRIDKNYNEYDLAPFCKAIEYFVDNTMMQEKLELRPDEEINGDEKLQLNNEDESYQQQNRRRKVVEDDSSPEQPIQTAIQQLEQLDIGKVRVRKLPMKLFGTYYETLRLNLIEQLKQDCNLVKLKICLEVLGQIVQDYINRKITQQIVTQIPEKKKVEEVHISKQVQIEPAVVEPEIKVQNLRQRVKTQSQSIYVESKWEDRCNKCGQGGKVICCDTCPKVFHTKCLGLKEVPKGKWNCLVCLSNFERQVKTRATIKKLENN
ncbi:unnamed protein product (macronuclear) [Paramecium tetraurelia]|uniref:PHD-type domain-containing protein n=1 Tax=Paramecium tetraurelia TaxID=5888 RepID=A0DQM0_PARTE|nr:uncharacterized protein GSPATT00002737001 [Paramecium tetraurelia]CAK85337.1 unnamed protein product [Paramecium tetraurelia]|eukprot:XP_001452734.1 hypothetical protein (macronuclear) [Paramecium tetraurelia strain d4-2]